MGTASFVKKGGTEYDGSEAERLEQDEERGARKQEK